MITQNRRRRRLALRIGVAVAAMASLAGMLAMPPVGAARAAEGSSELQVSWLDDDSRAAALQPPREYTSLSGEPTEDEPITNPHYEDFADVEVTVSHTEGLSDQTVSVRVTGMPGATVTRQRGLPGNNNGTDNVAFQQNFLQVMQCWGDPLADDFRETCQFGAARIGGVAQYDAVEDTMHPTAVGGTILRSVQGKVYTANDYNLPEGQSAMSEILSSTTSNELIAVPVSQDGSSSFAFEVHSHVQAPWLGCGAPDESGAPRQCSLVVVPRGTIYGGAQPAPSHTPAPPAEYGMTAMQVGSPLLPEFDYWDNRIVVPLSFRSADTGCGVGSAQLVANGSQLVAEAMNSWQRGLCAIDDVPIAYSTNADGRSRVQLLQGDFALGFTSRPLLAAELGEELAPQLEETEIVYAPLTISGITVAVRISGQRGIKTEVNLTPRLIAKLLTQSYGVQVPHYGRPFLREHLGTNPAGPLLDKEFQAANPGLGRPDLNAQTMFDLVLMGPSGADGFRLLWEYLQADDRARAFLSGEPDENGMTINPYFLPAGHPAAVVPLIEDVDGTLQYVVDAEGEHVMTPVGLADADGAPLDLASAAIDYLPLADQTLAPATWGNPQNRWDSTVFTPYAETFEKVATRVFRADPARPLWDPNKFVAPDVPRGAWTTSGQQFAPNVRMMGVTDTSSAASYQLAVARLALPNQPDVFVAPDRETMSAALPAQVPLGAEGTTWPDLAAIPDGAYPLTLVTYAAVNLSASDANQRADMATLIEFAVSSGQEPGERAGQLPEGYAPLTEQQRQEATNAAARIRAFTTPEAPAPPTAVDGTPTSPTTGGGTQTGVGIAPGTAAEMTPVVATAPANAVGGALLAGLVGLIGAPFLFRRRTAG